MPRLELNLDAYRLAADILERLRTLLRRHLQVAHGPNWESEGIPPDPREFLLQRRTRENNVKWHPTSGGDLLDFASFANLHDVLIAHPRLRDGFRRLVPEPQALRLRFLELDSVLNRLAFARPVTESDMELLLGFDERLRPLVGELLDDQSQPPRGAAEQKAPVVPGPRSASHWADDEPPPPLTLEPPPTVSRAAQGGPAPTPSPAPLPTSEARPMHAQASTPAAADRPSAAVSSANEGPAAPVSKELGEALRRGDDRVVLTSLYYEVTAIAEKIWADATSARSPVWEAVRESTWYRDRFSAMRLRVVSDFYDLLRAVQDRVASGSTRGDLHEFLKDHNFAQLLMDLREFFKPLQSAAHR